jgi:hypothetical protein
MYALPANRGTSAATGAGADALGRDTQLNGTGGSFLRPRGDITTVLDLTSRDAQDGTFFPPDTPSSWFHRSPFTTYPATMVTQEYPHKGTAAWGGRLTFELGALTAGDLLQAVVLQIKLGSWYNADTVLKLLSQEYGISPTSPTPGWTYVNGLGTSIIEYAEFEVGDQTLERLDGAFIRAFQSLFPDENMIYGMATDGLGLGSAANVANNTGPMNIDRPWPTEGGNLFCILPFFFFRTRFKEVFPLLSVPDGTVRIHVQLRPFDQCVRNSLHIRSSCTQTPLGQTVQLYELANPANRPSTQTVSEPPAFLDFRVVTYSALVSGSVREAYIHKPFEQLTKFVQNFYFDEPYNYLGGKPNPETDTIEISVPLELNHPCVELFWVFRRKGVQINNEWGNFGTLLESQWTADAVPPAWLDYATLRVNGLVVEQADGEWWRYSIAKAHRGGINAYGNNVYGYSFARDPDQHQPSGTANMSRASSVRLDLRVRVPPAVANPGGFEAAVGQGWELFVYAIHYNWLRFENGICQKIFED